jgi:hypothetical protein
MRGWSQDGDPGGRAYGAARGCVVGHGGGAGGGGLPAFVLEARATSWHTSGAAGAGRGVRGEWRPWSPLLLSLKATERSEGSAPLQFPSYLKAPSPGAFSATFPKGVGEKAN